MRTNGKVTRTKVTGVMRMQMPDGTSALTVLGDLNDTLVGLLKEKNPGAEIGYMPLAYEMGEREFIEKATLITNKDETPIFPTAKECPKSVQALKRL